MNRKLVLHDLPKLRIEDGFVLARVGCATVNNVAPTPPKKPVCLAGGPDVSPTSDLKGLVFQDGLKGALNPQEVRGDYQTGVLTAERLREVLHYDPASGGFRWRVRPSNRVRAGDVAGSLASRDYRIIMIDGHSYKASRLAFFYMTGSWPLAGINHINLDHADDRWANLREATRSQIKGNQPAQRNNTSGLKGVSWLKSRSKWQAQIQIDGNQKHLGNFDSPELAHAAYAAAAQLHFGEFARTE
jgi:HNH endonuclease/AP2 domain